jgi:hypothetical protein
MTAAFAVIELSPPTRRADRLASKAASGLVA